MSVRADRALNGVSDAISLLVDLLNIYGDTALQLTIIANKGFITTLFCAVSSYLLYLLVKRDPSPQIYGISIVANLYRVIALILLFLSGLLEINHQWYYYYQHTGLNILYLLLYLPMFTYLFYILSSKINGDRFNWRVGMGLLVCCVIIYLALIPEIFELQRNMLEHHQLSPAHFIAHWMGAVFIGLVFYQFIRICQNKFNEDVRTPCTWVLTAAMVLFLSLELSLASNMLFYSTANSVDLVQTVYIKTGLPILWGLLSFALMWTGMRNKTRILRIISLSLFTITLIKLFLFDINNIPVAGKIAAFFCLGILLLIISFMYQKVKKIIVDDKDKPKDE